MELYPHPVYCYKAENFCYLHPAIPAYGTLTMSNFISLLVCKDCFNRFSEKLKKIEETK